MVEYCDLVIRSRSQRGNHTFLYEVFVKSAIAREFGVERRQQVPALTERDHRLRGPAVGCGIREQRFGNARNDFD